MKYLQLVCVTTMLLVSKYEEMYPPTVGDFVFTARTAVETFAEWRESS